MTSQSESSAERAATPILRRKLSHEVQQRLLAGIRSGSYPVGELLPSERELMAQFGVGRPAVREGLQALERMGLIAIVHGEGARVQPLSADSVIAQISASAVHLLSGNSELLEHLKEARLAFEVAMARSAAMRATPEDIKGLREALETHRASLGDPLRFLETDLALHKVIAAVSGNPVYVAVSQAMLQWLRNFHEDLVRAPGAEEVTVDEHERMIESIARHDPDGAEQAVREHLTRANQKYRTIW
jgi:DNA-binding FadR family transcriptional regulator